MGMVYFDDVDGVTHGVIPPETSPATSSNTLKAATPIPTTSGCLVFSFLSSVQYGGESGYVVRLQILSSHSMGGHVHGTTFYKKVLRQFVAVGKE